MTDTDLDADSGAGSDDAAGGLAAARPSRPHRRHRRRDPARPGRRRAPSSPPAPTTTRPPRRRRPPRRPHPPPPPTRNPPAPTPPPSSPTSPPSSPTTTTSPARSSPTRQIAADPNHELYARPPSVDGPGFAEMTVGDRAGLRDPRRAGRDADSGRRGGAPDHSRPSTATSRPFPPNQVRFPLCTRYDYRLQTDSKIELGDGHRRRSAGTAVRIDGHWVAQPPRRQRRASSRARTPMSTRRFVVAAAAVVVALSAQAWWAPSAGARPSQASCDLDPVTMECGVDVPVDVPSDPGRPAAARGRAWQLRWRVPGRPPPPPDPGSGVANPTARTGSSRRPEAQAFLTPAAAPADWAAYHLRRGSQRRAAGHVAPDPAPPADVPTARERSRARVWLAGEGHG